MYQDYFDTLFIRFHGDIGMMCALQQVAGTDPVRFINELRQWIDKKCISCRVCQDCKAELKFNGLSAAHVVSMICPECGRRYNYFQEGI